MIKQIFKVHKDTKTYHFQFEAKAKDERDYRHNVWRMHRKLEDFFRENRLNINKSIMYRTEILDRRTLKHLRKGYKRYRFSYTLWDNIVREPSKFW